MKIQWFGFFLFAVNRGPRPSTMSEWGFPAGVVLGSGLVSITVDCFSIDRVGKPRSSGGPPVRGPNVGPKLTNLRCAPSNFVGTCTASEQRGECPQIQERDGTSLVASVTYQGKLAQILVWKLWLERTVLRTCCFQCVLLFRLVWPLSFYF